MHEPVIIWMTSMRLGTQARRGWPFRGAYQAFTFSVPLCYEFACNIRAFLPVSILSTSPLSFPRHTAFASSSSLKDCQPESICLLNTSTVHTFLIGSTWCPTSLRSSIRAEIRAEHLQFTENSLYAALFRSPFHVGPFERTSARC